MATTAEEMEQRWDEFLGEVCLRMSAPTFDTWLRHSRPLAHDGETLVVGVTHTAAAPWIEHRLLPALREPLERYFPGLAVQVRPLSPGENGDGPADREVGSREVGSGEVGSGGVGSGGREVDAEAGGDEAVEVDASPTPPWPGLTSARPAGASWPIMPSNSGWSCWAPSPSRPGSSSATRTSAATRPHGRRP